jgi:hypothetical protein
MWAKEVGECLLMLIFLAGVITVLVMMANKCDGIYVRGACIKQECVR